MVSVLLLLVLSEVIVKVVVGVGRVFRFVVGFFNVLMCYVIIVFFNIDLVLRIFFFFSFF